MPAVILIAASALACLKNVSVGCGGKTLVGECDHPDCTEAVSCFAASATVFDDVANVLPGESGQDDFEYKGLATCEWSCGAVCENHAHKRTTPLTDSSRPAEFRIKGKVCTKPAGG